MRRTLHGNSTVQEVPVHQPYGKHVSLWPIPYSSWFGPTGAKIVTFLVDAAHGRSVLRAVQKWNA